MTFVLTRKQFSRQRKKRLETFLKSACREKKSGIWPSLRSYFDFVYNVWVFFCERGLFVEVEIHRLSSECEKKLEKNGK